MKLTVNGEALELDAAISPICSPSSTTRATGWQPPSMATWFTARSVPPIL